MKKYRFKYCIEKTYIIPIEGESPEDAAENLENYVEDMCDNLDELFFDDDSAYISDYWEDEDE